MEKLLNPYEKEYMRMAMLKHEETFKQQVYELHRLYKVQKILMKNTETNPSKKEFRNQNNISNHKNIGIGSIGRVDGEDARAEQVLDFGVGSDTEMIDESEIELTLGPTCYGPSRKKKSSSSVSDSRRSLSSTSTTGSTNNNNGTSKIIIEERTMQERLIKQQPWLHVLSLNVN
ncbi:PREDICTED: uncharacterized protein LOC104827558 [Tarenaya hassleriana]|uniref:uncharacterized protein LOC104827558 n=1 Tax=Tarenaya hassleriana TaxID=28532 RepID=UPI00053C4CE4|nr:PREDICTED: uncharacterized protein LOC104827558 [Tarenaya hassleriana]